MKIAFVSTWRAKGGWPHYSDSVIDGLAGLGISCEKFPIDSLPLSNLATALDWHEVNKCDIAHIQYEISFFNQQNRNVFQNFISYINIPVVVTLHEIYQENPFIYPFSKVGGSNKVISKIKKYLYWWKHPLHYSERKLYSSNFYAKRITVHSEYHVSIIKSMGCSRDMIRVIEHGVPCVAKGDKDLLKEAYGLKGKQVILTFGFLYPNNNYHYIISMLRYLDPKIVYVIAGGAREEMHKNIPGNIEKFARLNGVGDRVRITGFLDEKKRDDFLSLADFYAAPFEIKSTSGSLCWAIGAGLPIITATSQMTDDMNARVPCLMLYDKANTDNFKKQLAWLVQDPDLQNKLRAGAEKYSQNYSYESMCRKLKSVYEEITDY
ncbi:MAG: glycosyltransferase [bacterium]